MPLTNFKNMFPAYRDLEDTDILGRIKNKYPAYAGLSDDDLTNRLESKFAAGIGAPPVRPEVPQAINTKAVTGIRVLNKKYFGDQNISTPPTGNDVINDVSGKTMAQENSAGLYGDGQITIPQDQLQHPETFYHESVHRAKNMLFYMDPKAFHRINAEFPDEETLANGLVSYIQHPKLLNDYPDLKSFYDGILGGKFSTPSPGASDQMAADFSKGKPLSELHPESTVAGSQQALKLAEDQARVNAQNLKTKQSQEPLTPGKLAADVGSAFMGGFGEGAHLAKNLGEAMQESSTYELMPVINPDGTMSLKPSPRGFSPAPAVFELGKILESVSKPIAEGSQRGAAGLDQLGYKGKDSASQVVSGAGKILGGFAGNLPLLTAAGASGPFGFAGLGAAQGASQLYDAHKQIVQTQFDAQRAIQSIKNSDLPDIEKNAEISKIANGANDAVAKIKSENKALPTILKSIALNEIFQLGGSLGSQVGGILKETAGTAAGKLAGSAAGRAIGGATFAIPSIINEFMKPEDKRDWNAALIESASQFLAGATLTKPSGGAQRSVINPLLGKHAELKKYILHNFGPLIPKTKLIPNELQGINAFTEELIATDPKTGIELAKLPFNLRVAALRKIYGGTLENYIKKIDPNADFTLPELKEKGQAGQKPAPQTEADAEIAKIENFLAENRADLHDSVIKVWEDKLDELKRQKTPGAPSEPRRAPVDEVPQFPAEVQLPAEKTLPVEQKGAFDKKLEEGPTPFFDEESYQLGANPLLNQMVDGSEAEASAKSIPERAQGNASRKQALRDLKAWVAENLPNDRQLAAKNKKMLAQRLAQAISDRVETLKAEGRDSEIQKVVDDFGKALDEIGLGAEKKVALESIEEKRARAESVSEVERGRAQSDRDRQIIQEFRGGQEEPVPAEEFPNRPKAIGRRVEPEAPQQSSGAPTEAGSILDQVRRPGEPGQPPETAPDIKGNLIAKHAQPVLDANGNPTGWKWVASHDTVFMVNEDTGVKREFKIKGESNFETRAEVRDRAFQTALSERTKGENAPKVTPEPPAEPATAPKAIGGPKGSGIRRAAFAVKAVLGAGGDIVQNEQGYSIRAKNGKIFRLEFTPLPGMRYAEWDPKAGVIHVDPTKIDSGDVSHEILHAMRDSGLIKNSEWRNLVSLANKMINRVTTRTTYEKFLREQKGDPTLRVSEEFLDHEQVAKMMELWRRRGAPKDMRSVFQKARDYVFDLADSLKIAHGEKSEYATAKDVVDGKPLTRPADMMNETVKYFLDKRYSVREIEDFKKSGIITKEQADAMRFVRNEGIMDLSGKPIRVDKNGMVTLYHRTTTSGEEGIRSTGKFLSKENTDETFFSNRSTGQAEGYGGQVVVVRIPAKYLRVNDAFRDEIHVAVSNADVQRFGKIEPKKLDMRTAIEESTWSPEERWNLRYSLRSLEESGGAGQLEKEMLEAGFSPKMVGKWTGDINNVAAVILAHRDLLDYRPDRKYSSLKSNADYGKSLDFSTICRKAARLVATVSHIQKKTGRALSPDEWGEISNRLKERGDLTSCAVCYVFSAKIHIGNSLNELARLYPDIPREVVYDFKQHGKLSDYKTPDSVAKQMFQKYLQDQKAHPDRNQNFSTWQEFREKHMPNAQRYLNARGQILGKAFEARTDYRREIKELSPKFVEVVNKIGGLRNQSWSDFEPAHLLDKMQSTIDGALIDLKMHSYTKVPDYVRLAAPTGEAVNMSLVPMGLGLDKNGKLIFSDTEGMPAKTAFSLREKHRTAGTILIGVSDAHIRAGMADPRIDYIIPYHKSGLPQSVAEAFGLSGWENYQNRKDAAQKEKLIDPSRFEQHVKGRISDGFTRSQLGLWPADYWDGTVDGDANAKNYLRKCAEIGVTPKFEVFKNDKGYWKLLVDRRMYDNDGKYIEQTPVRPTFDMKVVNDILQKSIDKKVPAIGENTPNMEVVKGFMKDPEVRTPRMNLREDQLSSPEFKKWFGKSKVVGADGKPLEVYHGTSSFPHFTEFNAKLRGPGFWFTSDRENAEFYKGAHGEVMPVFLSLQKPANARQFADAENLSMKELGRGASDEAIGRRTKAKLLKQGFDGVKYDAKKEDGTKINIFVAFEPTQIKSSTMNTGAFSRENPDIRFNLRDELPKDVLDFAHKNNMEYKGIQETYGLKDLEPLYLFNVPEARNTTIAIKESTLTADELSRARQAKIEEFAQAEGTRANIRQPVWYSQLRRVVDQKMANRASVEDVKRMLDPSKSGVKADELKWTGLQDFLDSKTGMVTKEEVLNAIQPVDVKEVLLGDYSKAGEWLPLKDGAGQKRKIGNRWTFVYTHSDGSITGVGPSGYHMRFDRLSDAMDYYDAQDVSASAHPTKFNRSDLNLPGGENYRELLLTLPITKQGLPERWRVEEWLPGAMPPGAKSMFSVYNESGEEVSRGTTRDKAIENINSANAPLGKALGIKDVYRSTHFDEPNILAHVRFNDRITENPDAPAVVTVGNKFDKRSRSKKTFPNLEEAQKFAEMHKGLGDFAEVESGKTKTLFLEEVQSDWHQKGREQGYDSNIIKTASVSDWKVEEGEHQYVLSAPNGSNVEIGKGTVSSEAEARQYATRYRNQQVKEQPRGVPDAPFAKTWHEHVMRRMLRWGAENGYDRVAWTTGEMQNERYDLSKQVDGVEITKLMDGRFDVRAWKGTLDNLINETVDSEKALSNLIGKELSEKAVKSEKGQVRFTGLDLKVGGEGMKGFYDKILPDYMNRYGKKWGAKVEETKINTGNNGTWSVVPVDGKWTLEYNDGVGSATLGTFNTEAEAQSRLDKMPEYKRYPQRETVHSILITESMRESVMQGQPMFNLRAPETPEFKKWFGGSKVVDENGKPLVVYHGTSGNFGVFKNVTNKSDRGFHFGTIDQANERLNSVEINDEGVNIKPVYLSIKNPMRVEDVGTDWAPVVSKAKKLGYDGLVYSNTNEVGNEFLKKAIPGETEFPDSYVAFYPEQIKSATGNRGTFDPNNPDIRFSLRQPNPEELRTAQEEYQKSGARSLNEFHKYLTGQGKSIEQSSRMMNAYAMAGQMPTGEGPANKSRFAQRLMQRTRAYEDVLMGGPEYQALNLDDSRSIGEKTAFSDPVSARRIALGLQQAPAGTTQFHVGLPLLAKLEAEGRMQEAAPIASAMSSLATRKGQDIASLRGAIGDNSPMHFVNQVMADRAKKAVGWKRDIHKSIRETIDQKVGELQKTLEQTGLSGKELSDYIDKLTCRI